jgi:hypothetical protein
MATNISKHGAAHRQPFMEQALPPAIGLNRKSGSLLDLTVRRALYDVLEHLEGRKYRARNLPAAATWEMFAGTKGVLTKEDFFDLLGDSRSKTDAHDFSRQRRSETKVRSQEINTLRSNALALVNSRSIPNSALVAGWVFVLVCAAALNVLKNANALELETVRLALDLSDASIEQVLDAVHDEIQYLVAEENRSAHDRLKSGHDQARSEVFLHCSAYGLLATMTRPEPPADTQRLIMEGLYPVIDDFGDPLED